MWALGEPDSGLNPSSSWISCVTLVGDLASGPSVSQSETVYLSHTFSN